MGNIYTVLLINFMPSCRPNFSSGLKLSTGKTLELLSGDKMDPQMLRENNKQYPESIQRSNTGSKLTNY